MADLFLSYARDDRECAELFARALSSRGYSVWWDRRIPVGRSFSEVIEQELDQARCVIVLWSQHTLRSQWVQTEAEEAARRKVLVPVRIEDVRPPLEFRRLHTADLFDWRNGFAGGEFEECLASIDALVRKADPAQQEAAPSEQKPAAEAPRPAAEVSSPTSEKPASHERKEAPVPEFWINQDGRQFVAPSSATLRQWADEGRVRANSQVFDPLRRQWVLARDINFLASAYERKTAKPRLTFSPELAGDAKRPASLARVLGIAGVGLLLLIIIAVSIIEQSSKSAGTAASDTAATTAVDTAETSTTSTSSTTAVGTAEMSMTGTTGTMSLDTTPTSTSGTMAMTDSGSTSSTSAMPAPRSVSVSLENRCTDKKVNVAVCYLDANGVWNGKGWFIVGPKETKSGVIDAIGPWIYFYGEWGQSRWEAQKSDRSFTAPVHDTNKFNAPIDQLRGDGFKSVQFFGREVDAGESTYTQVFTCSN